MGVKYFDGSDGFPALDWQILKHESSAFTGNTNSTHGDVDNTPTYTIFTVTGMVIVKTFWSRCNVSLTEGGATATIVVGFAGDTNAFMTAQNAVSFDAGELWSLATLSSATAGIAITDSIGHGYLLNSTDIIETVGGAQDVDSGQIDYFCIWAPMELEATIVEAGTLS